MTALLSLDNDILDLGANKGNEVVWIYGYLHTTHASTYVDALVLQCRGVNVGGQGSLHGYG